MSGKSNAVVGVVNFGAGNLGNVERALRRLDIGHVPLNSPDDMRSPKPSLLLLPGVGAFPPAMASLVSTGWMETLVQWASEGRPLLGICLGMQLLCTLSAEDGETEGLGLLEGDVNRLSGVKKIPHMGWNEAIPADGENFLADCIVKPGQNFYFVHSFAVSDSPHRAAMTTVEDVAFCSALRRDNVAGFQFHPERSGPEGVEFLGRAIKKLMKFYRN
ncbi:MAG: imidazole glycerol phosphate synthase subunit HisH [Synergistaceae bacterium]|nr:imidazole glycerol phosphate synthase subunit HisH [Synergistaceae bacterium]